MLATFRNSILVSSDINEKLKSLFSEACVCLVSLFFTTEFYRNHKSLVSVHMLSDDYMHSYDSEQFRIIRVFW